MGSSIHDYSSLLWEILAGFEISVQTNTCIDYVYCISGLPHLFINRGMDTVRTGIYMSVENPVSSHDIGEKGSVCWLVTKFWIVLVYLDWTAH